MKNVERRLLAITRTAGRPEDRVRKYGKLACGHIVRLSEYYHYYLGSDYRCHVCTTEDLK
jgi:hypothetical protein